MKIKTMEDVLKETYGKPILVANRGIPARRICRAIRERFHGIAMMTATDIDKSTPSSSAAQELLLLGADPRAYLDIDLIITLAKKRGVVAIHPGWGFASEDDRFPAKCAEAGILFIGADAEAMNSLGNKVQARILAKKIGVPVVPGSEGAVTIEEARKIIQEIGLPVMLKAEGGGGGRGIFAIRNTSELEDAFFKASAMAQASFGNPRLFVEKYLENVRHIEIQVIADKHGNVFAFDERDCSMQRNHQKLIEITPSPSSVVTPKLRAELKEYSKKLISAVKYHSLATVEFLVTQSGEAYLIEVNTRLQVEHGITECRYGIDLVEAQIAVAFGAKLDFSDEKTVPYNCAMQVRINCEDPQKNFTPNSGMITRYVSPGGPGVRLDSNLCAGYDFPSNYDSAGSLLITYAPVWEKVLGIMDRALGEYVIRGLKTTIPFYLEILKNEKFRTGEITTNFIAETPILLDYNDLAPESERLSRLVCEISARGYNPYVQLGQYRSIDTPTLPAFAPVLPPIDPKILKKKSPYPQKDRVQLLDFVRDSGKIHFTDTTPRDFTQSNSGNRFRLAEDRLLGPYLDNCDFFSIESGGGAHFHVAMLANMTNPFSEAKEWSSFAPKTLKQILVRSTNTLGYSPQPRKLMHLTAEMICDNFQVIRCFDFLNDIDNMYPFAETCMQRKDVIFEPAISMSWAKGFDVAHYLDVTEAIIDKTSKAAGLSKKETIRSIILGLKDMAGVCPPRFMTELVSAITKKYPELVLHYHRHYTDGLFVPSVGAAAKAGAHIIDVGLGSAVRSYAQGDVLSTSAYIEEELGLKTLINKDMIRSANYVCKQVMPYYDRYAPTYFNGIDHDVVRHGMPGGATSSSQEGAMKQGYIHLLPQMLKFLEGIRQIVRYHDVTPGSQITWNTAFLAITSAWKRGDDEEVNYLLELLHEVTTKNEKDLNKIIKDDRLKIFQDCNDAFKNLLLGKFGKLPLGFPADWVYKSAFGNAWKKALKDRTTDCPLNHLQDVDLDEEYMAFAEKIKRVPTNEEFVMYLNHPGDAIKTIEFQEKFSDPNNLPLNIWFEGLKIGDELVFNDSTGKPHVMSLYNVSKVNDLGYSIVRYRLDSEFLTYEVKLGDASKSAKKIPMGDPANPCHVSAPSNGDLWIMYVSPGDIVKAGTELFNISIMKQEKAVLAKTDGIVKRVLKTADYKESRKMLSVVEGELLVELGPIPLICPHPDCQRALPLSDIDFCPWCGEKLPNSDEYKVKPSNAPDPLESLQG